MSKIIYKSINILVITLLSVGSLEAQTIEIVDGVRIVHNEKPKWGNNPQVELRFARQIGEFNSTDDNFIFGRIIDLAVDAVDNIYLVDYQNFRIQKFDPEGRFLKTYGSGRKGQGPAEFEYPSRISIGSDGSLYISDYKKKLLIVLNQDGSEKRRFMPESNYFEKFMLNSKDQIIMPGSNRISPEDLIRMQFQYSWEELQKMDFNPFMFSINDNDGKRLREFGQKKIFDEMRMNNLGNRYYDAIDKEDNFYVSFEVQNRIEKYSREGKLLLKIDRKTDFKETNEKVLEDGPPGGIPSIKYNYFSFGIGVDHKERIWVLGVNKQKKVWNDKIGMHLEIYDRTGILLGILPLPLDIYFPKLRVFGNKVFLIDNVDELAVFIYDVVEK